MEIHVADVEPAGVGDVGDLLVGDDDGRRQEPALGADLDPRRPGRADRGVDVRDDTGRVGERGRHFAAFSATSVPLASATYHWRLKNRSLAALRIRNR